MEQDLSDELLEDRATNRRGRAGKPERASYGDRILIQLSKDLNQRFGKGFSDRNLRYMRRFFQFYKLGKISPELSWTHYKALLLVNDFKIRDGLEKEAIVKGWSHRELLLKAQAVLRNEFPLPLLRRIRNFQRMEIRAFHD